MFTKNEDIHPERIISLCKHQSSKVILESMQSCFERKMRNQEIKKFPETTNIKSFDDVYRGKKYFEL